MKMILLSIVLLTATSSFAIMAPTGEYVEMTCVSVEKNRAFTVNLMRVAKNDDLKMVLNAKGQAPRTYVNVNEQVSDRIGAPVTYSARVPGGMVKLEVNFTTSPSPKGRKGFFVSQVYGKATKTQLLCNTINY